MHYRISFHQPQHRFVDIEVKIPSLAQKKINLQLPAWRPGRYELGNFAKNVRCFQVFDEKGSAVPFKKLTKDSWEVLASGTHEILVKYQYYAADLNAGSTFLDAGQLYMNPVNCLIYVPERIDEAARVELHLPFSWELACGLTKETPRPEKDLRIWTMNAGSFHELADSPFIASPNMKHASYECLGTNFNIWIQGECKPDMDRIVKDFSAFTEAQIRAFGEFPVKEYHFLLQILPGQFYHGVEHQTSSVNALGPGYELMRDRYDDLLGLCSHELYHAWNIKSIRPEEMWPYDYTRENYFKTGYVAEGVTTYLGDYFLLSSRVFDVPSYLAELSAQIQKHMDNFGRVNYSVADSSFDMWLDGYVPGVPERKVSIYTEGCLLAFIADVLILRNSDGKHSLHDVMKTLYTEYYQKGKGYSASDYRTIVEKFAGTGLCEYFDTLVNGKSSYLPQLRSALDYIGLELVDLDPNTLTEKHYGIKVNDAANGSVVLGVNPSDASYFAGIAPGDRIISVNGFTVNADANKWIAYFAGKEIELLVSRSGEMKSVVLPFVDQSHYRTWRVIRKENIDQQMELNFQTWSKLKP
jgi:predicted metalloprotease with PDZ domain